MAHYQYQRFTASSWSQQVYVSTSLVVAPATPSDTTKPAVAINQTTWEVDWNYFPWVGRVKARSFDVTATITPTATTWTVATTQDAGRIVNGTIPVASATYEWVILEVSWLTAPIVPTSWQLLNVWEMSNGDLVICENSNWTRQWKKLSDKWWNEHLLAWTRSTIVWLRTAWQLVPWRSYQITDHVQGRLVAWTTVTLLATSTTEFSHDARVNTTYDNTSWFWLYDIDAAIVYELSDNRGNKARGINGTEVANFDWGNTSYTNVVVDNGTLTIDIGNPTFKRNIIVEKTAVLTLTGFTGAMNDITFSTGVTANFTNANGTWRLSTIRGGGGFNVSGYTGGGDNYYNEIDGACNINFSNSSSIVTFRQNHVISAAINHTWVSTWAFTLTNTSIRQYTITHSAWALAFTSNWCEYFWAWTVNHLTWTVTINNVLCAWSVNSNTAAWNTSINWWEILQSTVTNLSAWTLSLTRCYIRSNSSVSLNTWSWWNTSLTDCIFEQSSSLQKLNTSTTWNINLRLCKFYSNGFLQTGWTWNFTWNQCSMSWFSRINITWWNRSYWFTRVDWFEVAQINLSWTWAWVSDNFNDIHISARWVLLDSATWTAANNINYARISWLSWWINIAGNTSSQTLQRVTAEDWTLTVSWCTFNMIHDMINLSKVWNLTITNIAVNKPVTYCDIWAQWSLSVTWTAVWWITRINITWWSCSISWTTSTVTNLVVEQWSVNITWWSITNCSKKMNSTWIITWWVQNNTHHWNATNKSSAVNNTNRVDYLGVISSVPIL